ncbi:MAG: AlkA N-terminal domain-containing protein, partial [Nannocystaceae bacterium]
MELDPDACYAALRARDARFDGLFFVGVQTTGIYCRPVCAARTPGRGRCEFFATRAGAERAGFRACLRCRPELAPGAATIDAPGRLVARAVQAIEAGALQGGSVDDLAAALGVSGRHLRRAMERALGVGPIELATTRRIGLAKQLIQDTSLPLAEVAFAAGFGSVRRFNAAFAERFGRPPGELRRGAPARDRLSLRLDYRPPLDWEGLLGFLALRAIPGVERVDGDTYARVVCLKGQVCAIQVRPEAGAHALRLEVEGSIGGEVMALAAAVRRLFDLDASPEAITAAFADDPALGPRARRRPGLRVPGAIDPFEITIRALLGQQVSVKAATTLAGRLVARLGADAPGLDPALGLSRRFPSAATLASAGAAEIAAIGLPEGRARAIHALAAQVSEGTLSIDPVCSDRDEV